MILTINREFSPERHWNPRSRWSLNLYNTIAEHIMQSNEELRKKEMIIIDVDRNISGIIDEFEDDICVDLLERLQP